MAQSSVLSKTVYALPLMDALSPAQSGDDDDDEMESEVEGFSVEETEKKERGYLSDLLDSGEGSSSSDEDEETQALHELERREALVTQMEKALKSLYQTLWKESEAYMHEITPDGDMADLVERQRALQEGRDRLEKEQSSVPFLLRNQLLREPRDTVTGAERDALMAHLNKAALFAVAVAHPHGVEVLSARIEDYFVLVIRCKTVAVDEQEANLLCSVTIRSDSLRVQ